MTPAVVTPRVRRPRRAVVLTVSLLVVALVGAGCTGGGSDADGGAGGGADSGAAGGDRTGRQVQLDARVGKVAGGLPKPRRQKAVRQVGGVVDRWFEAAYLGGDYPRRSFKRVWPGWSRDLRRQARADRRLTSNAGIGRSTRSVIGRRKQVRVDVLAWKGWHRSATARFTLVFDQVPRKEAHRTTRHRVNGRLMLVPTGKGGWRVVGYDVSRSRKAVRGGGGR